MQIFEPKVQKQEKRGKNICADAKNIVLLQPDLLVYTTPQNLYSVSVYRGVREEKSLVLIPYDEESPGSTEHRSG